MPAVKKPLLTFKSLAYPLLFFFCGYFGSIAVTLVITLFVRNLDQKLEIFNQENIWLFAQLMGYVFIVLQVGIRLFTGYISAAITKKPSLLHLVTIWGLIAILGTLIMLTQKNDGTPMFVFLVTRATELVLILIGGYLYKFMKKL